VQLYHQFENYMPVSYFPERALKPESASLFSTS